MQKKAQLNIWYLVLAMIAIMWLQGLWQQMQSVESIPYSRFERYLAEGKIEKIVIGSQTIRGTFKVPQDGGHTAFVTTKVETVLAERLKNSGVEYAAAIESTFIKDLLSWVVPALVFFGIWFFFVRKLAERQGFGGLMTVGKSKAKVYVEKETGVSFDDVAGVDEAKAELVEIVEFLKNPERFSKLGAEVPRGVLLMGAPGTGKTLMAKALAGEAGVPFYSISGSEFIEVFVGVGAGRVRSLFDIAKKNAPSIIFIDELDSIGRTRGTGLGGGHDEREQTLNQILAELDGFSGRENVIVLAATNRPDVLDPALLRPGRFDRHVTLDLPDRKDRVAILKVHTRKLPLAEDVDLDSIAAGTPGFSGADIKNLANEAAMFAGRNKQDQVLMQDFDEARDKLLMGTVRTLAIKPEERHRLAVHEAGHTLVAYFIPHADPLYKVTIIPRGRALGGTQQLPEEERHTLPEEYLQDRLAVILGGRCAEKELLGSLSSGADDDIYQATTLARAMVGRWGMSDEVGPVDLRESEEHPFLGREIAQPRRYSEHSAQTVDEAVRKLILEAEQRALDIVKQHRQQLDQLITKLQEKETLGRHDIEQCLGPSGKQHQNVMSQVKN